MFTFDLSQKLFAHYFYFTNILYVHYDYGLTLAAITQTLHDKSFCEWNLNLSLSKLNFVIFLLNFELGRKHFMYDSKWNRSITIKIKITHTHICTFMKIYLLYSIRNVHRKKVLILNHKFHCVVSSLLIEPLSNFLNWQQYLWILVNYSINQWRLLWVLWLLCECFLCNWNLQCYCESPGYKLAAICGILFVKYDMNLFIMTLNIMLNAGLP